MITLQTPTKNEVRLLKDHRNKSNTPLIRDRAHTILLAHKGYSAPEIAHILDRNRVTIEDWISHWNDTRVSSVFPKYEGNTNAAKLTQEQRNEIQKTLGSSSTDDGLPSDFWTVQKLKKYLTAQYGVVYESDRSYHHIFAISSYSFKLPEGRNWRRNDELVAKRMLEIQAEINEARRKNYLIFAADECSLSWETILRRAWIKRGEKTMITVESDKRKQHYFGALNLKSHRHELIALDWQNTENIIEALRELTKRYPHRKFCIIWDNAGWHRSKALRSYLGKGKEFEHIHLVWLPPYAPDENPEEHVWKVGKEAVSNHRTKTFIELKQIFEESISNKNFNYQM